MLLVGKEQIVQRQDEERERQREGGEGEKRKRERVKGRIRKTEGCKNVYKIGHRRERETEEK